MNGSKNHILKKLTIFILFFGALSLDIAYSAEKTLTIDKSMTANTTQPLSNNNNNSNNQPEDINRAEINFNFENASLELFLTQVEKIFSVAFIYDNLVKDEINKDSKENSKDLSTDTKISFRTNHPLTKIQAWAIVDAFLDLAGMARVQISEANQVFRITKTEVARKEALPSFIGTELNKLPESGIIRYVYFLKNSNAESMKATIDSLKSKNAILTTYPDLNALIFTDQVYNIKTLMVIVKELDSACTPVALSVLKLKEADALEVAQLYEDLKNKGTGSSGAGGFGASANKANTQHFLQEANVFAEPRTNTLIIIGPPEANMRIEKFITEHIDTKLAKRRSGVHSIELNHVPAVQMAEILNSITKFGSNTEASKFGSTMRGGEKYFNRMFFEAEKQSNNLIVRGEEEDFLSIKDIVKDLDKAQPQVAIEVLIVSLDTIKTNGITSQLNNKNNGSVNFQTSGFGGTGTGDGSGIVLSPTGSLVSNLINLATSAQIGSTVLSLGKDSVWSLLSILSKDAKTNVLSNPFLVTTNKYPAYTSLGEERRVVTGTVQGASTTATTEQSALSADLQVKITPRINSLGIINLNIDVIIENFTEPANSQYNGNKLSKTLHTNASVCDGEALAIGGLSRDTDKFSNSSVPLLSRIPIIGNWFKTKNQSLHKENLIIFITPKVVRPNENLNAYTKNKANFVTDILTQIDKQAAPSDPITKWIFDDQSKPEKKIVSDFVAKHGSKNTPMRRQAITGAIQDIQDVRS